jgi:hypothetical protein
MTMRRVSICIITLVAATALGRVPPAQALTMKECSAKYQVAQQAGTPQGMRWNDFRKAECTSNASASQTPSAAAVSSQSASAPTSPPAATSPKRSAASRAVSPAAGNALFPTAISPKYSSESRARLECIPVLINTSSTKVTTAITVSNGFRRVAATTANAISS